MNGMYGWNDSNGPGCFWAALVGIFILGCLAFGVIMLFLPETQASDNASFYASQARYAATNHEVWFAMGADNLEENETHQTTGTVIIAQPEYVFLTHGSSETLQFRSPQGGLYTLTIYSHSSANAYPSRVNVSVNGAPPTSQSFQGIGDSNCNRLCVQTTPITIKLNAGQNTITISNDETDSQAQCTNTNEPNFGNDLDNCNFIAGIGLVPYKDYTNLYPWIGIALIVIACVAAFFFLRRKKRK